MIEIQLVVHFPLLELSLSTPLNTARKLTGFYQDQFFDIVESLFPDHCNDELNRQLIMTSAMLTTLPAYFQLTHLNMSPFN